MKRMSAMGIVVFLIFTGIPWSTTAQEGNFLESLAETPAISRGQLVTLLESAGLSAENEGQGSTVVRADELAHVIMQLESDGGNLGYHLFPGPRYAIRTLRDQQLYPDSPRILSAGSPVDGVTALQLIRPALTRAVAQDTERAAVQITPRTVSARPQGPWAEWDLEQNGGVAYRDDGSSVTELTSTSVLDARVVFNPRAQLVTQVEATGLYADDDTEAADVRLPRARLDLFREPQGGGWTGSLSMGRIDDTDVTHDGVAAKFSSGSAIASASVGYTGGVAAALNRIPGADTDSPRERPLGEGQFSPERIVAHGDVVLPEIWGRQNPSTTVISVVDPAETDALTQVRLGLSGPLSVSLFYDLSADIQFGQRHGWASRGSLRWYPDVTRTTQLELSAAVAGSDRNDNQGYTALGDDPPWSAFPGSFTNIAATTLRYTARLGEPWLVSASSTLLGRIDPDGSVASAASTVNDAALLGWEGGANLGIQPVPDLFFDLNSNIFVPGTEAWSGAYSTSAEPMWSVGLQFTARL
ncbi:MAG: hypothetical protein R6U25_04745 [Alkalispirochaeta sp.]